MKTAVKATNTAVVNKSFNNSGKWIVRKTKSEILTCTCGAKYIKTRPRQKTCLRCMFVQK